MRGDGDGSDEDLSDADSECLTASDDDADVEPAASAALFSSGRSSLLDLNSVDKPSDVLAAVRKTADAAAKATDGGIPSSSSHGAPSAASAAANGRGHMARGEQSSSGKADSVNLVNSGKGKANAPAPATPPRKYYVVPNGESRGVYFGTWNAPDRIRLAAENVPALGATVTSQKVTGIPQAARFCVAQAQAGARRCSVFRGPHLPPTCPGLAIGDDVLVFCGLVEAAGGM